MNIKSNKVTGTNTNHQVTSSLYSVFESDLHNYRNLLEKSENKFYKFYYLIYLILIFLIMFKIL
jgi:hypothetical protein